MKIGIEVKIDVTKIEKAKLYKGEKGTYLTMTTFVDLDSQDQYGNNGFIARKKDKDEQENPPILGNVKVFWTDNNQQQQQPRQQQRQPANMPKDDFDSDIPF